jgi:hypothetical protein
MATKDDHDSWGMCKTSIECRTIMIAVLTVMSSMDLHTISGNLGMGLDVGLELVSLVV